MASEPDGVPAADDTLVLAAADVASAEEVTLADDGEWPVTELYYVEPDAAPSEAERAVTEPIGTVVATESAPTTGGWRRKLVPGNLGGPGVLRAVGAFVLALVLGAALLGRDEGDSAPAQTPGPAASSDPVEPSEEPMEPAVATVSVRDVEGMPLAEARATLLDQGFRVRVGRSRSDAPRDEVVSQTPEARSELARRTIIALVVSSGDGATEVEQVAVPDVIGLSASRAVSTIRGAGLEPRIRLVTASSQTGRVVEQTPASGVEIAEGETVRVDVARARPAVQRVQVPDVVGSTVSAARRELRALGFPTTVVRVPADDPAGTVLRQSPQAGVERAEGTTVELTVSSGPSKIDVPDVTGLDEASARPELEQAGFRVRVAEQPTDDPAEDGTVLGQSPVGGSAAAKGSIVTLTVGRFD